MGAGERVATAVVSFVSQTDKLYVMLAGLCSALSRVFSGLVRGWLIVPCGSGDQMGLY